MLSSLKKRIIQKSYRNIGLLFSSLSFIGLYGSASDTGTQEIEKNCVHSVKLDEKVENKDQKPNDLRKIAIVIISFLGVNIFIHQSYEWYSRRPKNRTIDHISSDEEIPPISASHIIMEKKFQKNGIDSTMRYNLTKSPTIYIERAYKKTKKNSERTDYIILRPVKATIENAKRLCELVKHSERHLKFESYLLDYYESTKSALNQLKSKERLNQEENQGKNRNFCYAAFYKKNEKDHEKIVGLFEIKEKKVIT